MAHVSQGCGGDAAVLSGSGGTFGVNADQYVRGMACQWMIHVEPTKVRDIQRCIQYTTHSSRILDMYSNMHYCSWLSP